MSNEISDKVCSVIRTTLGDETLADATLIADASLLELGVDSLKMFDLAVRLEESLGIRAFPMQLWADRESARTDKQFTVGSLIATCTELLDETAEEA